MHPRSLARPAVVVLATLALLAAACGDGLGPEELPEEIGSREREQITETLEAFFDGVNRYNPQVASEVMLLPADLGIPEVGRMVWEIGTLQPEELQFAFQSLGATQVVGGADGEPNFVMATAVTGFGPREFQLVRRGGRWMLSAVPDLSVPQDAGPVEFAVDVHRQDLTEDGSQVNVGEIVNSGTENAQIFSIAGIARDAEGHTIATSSGIVAKVILRPGETSPFRVTVGSPDAGAIAETTFIITAKRVPEGDFELFEAARFSVSEVERGLADEGGSIVQGTVRNSGLEQAIPFAAAVAYGVDGRLLAVGRGGDTGSPLGAGAERPVEIPLPELDLFDLVGEVTEVRLLVTGVVVR
ncbi:MAG: hypothetical protein O2895_02595 [Chloroflexi bacterium]|nr:hypothetical protein [Chloroflexota bacterium]